MIVYRLSRGRYRFDLSGDGAKVAGGRWNSIGVPVVYTAESRALAALEIAVHTQLNVIPDDYMMITISIPPKAAIHEIKKKELPADWKSFPINRQTQILGDKYLKENNFLGLKVPSAVIQGDYNILLNPLHTDFKSVKINSSERFAFDQRLFLRSEA